MSWALSPKATLEPSKTSDHAPSVTAPSEDGENSTMSSSRPFAPGTLKFPIVLRYKVPFTVTCNESIFSLFAAKPTSEPSKYNSRTPEVLVPKVVGVKRTISESSTRPRLPSLVGPDRLKRIEPSESTENAFISLTKPTSDPSK